MDVEALLTAVIAVLGTLLGSIVTYVFQRRSTERAAAFAYVERQRQERLDSYSGFAGALVRYRQAEVDRWHRWSEDPDGEPHQLAKAETHRRRAEAFDALFRVQLLTDDSEVRQAATDAVDVISEVHRAADLADREVRGKAARDAIDRFVAVAATRLRPAGPVEALLDDLD